MKFMKGSRELGRLDVNELVLSKTEKELIRLNQLVWQLFVHKEKNNKISVIQRLYISKTYYRLHRFVMLALDTIG